MRSPVYVGSTLKKTLLKRRGFAHQYTAQMLMSPGAQETTLVYMQTETKCLCADRDKVVSQETTVCMQTAVD